MIIIEAFNQLHSHQLFLFRTPIWFFLNNWNVHHSLYIQLILHFCFVQSWIKFNAEFCETVSESAVADRIHDVGEAGGVGLPVCCLLYVTSFSSHLKTQEVSVVLEFGSEVECIRTVHRTPLNNNSFCVAGGPNELLQVCWTELIQSNENVFGNCSDCLRKCVYVDFCIYWSYNRCWWIVNAEKL